MDEPAPDQPSPDWKRDPIWHYRNFVIAVIIGIITVAGAFLIYNWQKPVKALTCDVVAVGPLVSVEDDLNKRIQVVFDHKPVPNVKFAVIKISNPGNVPIVKADFERPLSLHFGGTGPTNVLTAQLLNTHPNNVGATYKVIGDTLTLDPLLLNPDDNITLKIIYTGEGENMSVDARIVGVSEVTGTDPNKETDHVRRNALTVALTTGILTLLSSFLVGLYTLRRDRKRLANDPAFVDEYIAKYASSFRFTEDDIARLVENARKKTEPSET